MSIKKLASQTAWYGLSNILARLIGALLSPLLTYLLGDEAEGMMNMGDFSTIYSLIAFANIIFTYGLETGYFRFVNNPDTNEKNLFNTTFGSLLISTLIMCSLLILFQQPISTLIHTGSHPEFMTLVAFIIGIDTLAAIPFARLRNAGKPKKYAFIKITGIITNILLIIFFLWFIPTFFKDSNLSIVQCILNTHNVYLILLSNVIQNIIVFTLLIKEWNQFSFKLDRSLWLKIIQYSSPMIIIGLAGMINEVMDRFLLLSLLPMNIDEAKIQVGIYSANYKLAVFVSFFIQAFKLGAEPFYFKQMNENNAKETYALVMKWFCIILCYAFLIPLLYLDIFTLINNENYRQGSYIVPIIIGANVCLGIYYNLSIWYKLANKMIWGIIITVTGAIITILVNIIMIPNYGIAGPAWATLICYSSMCFLAYLLGQKYYRIPYKISEIAAYFIVAIILYIFQILLKNIFVDYNNNIIINFIIGTILIGIFTIFLIKKEKININNILRKIKTK